MTIYTFECQQCHTAYSRHTRGDIHRRFCSKACAVEFMRKPPGQAECGQCGKMFEYQGARKRHRPPRFCGHECRQAWRRNRYRENYCFTLEPLLHLLPRHPLHSSAYTFGDSELASRWFEYETKKYTLMRTLRTAGWSEVTVSNRVNRAMRQGLTAEQADEMACALGWHPAEVWGPEWWQHA